MDFNADMKKKSRKEKIDNDLKNKFVAQILAFLSWIHRLITPIGEWISNGVLGAIEETTRVCRIRSHGRGMTEVECLIAVLISHSAIVCVWHVIPKLTDNIVKILGFFMYFNRHGNNREMC